MRTRIRFFFTCLFDRFAARVATEVIFRSHWEQERMRRQLMGAVKDAVETLGTKIDDAKASADASAASAQASLDSINAEVIRLEALIAALGQDPDTPTVLAEIATLSATVDSLKAQAQAAQAASDAAKAAADAERPA